jgi:eukaryotic-like serine/threonine-protein kinase
VSGSEAAEAGAGIGPERHQRRGKRPAGEEQTFAFYAAAAALLAVLAVAAWFYQRSRQAGVPAAKDTIVLADFSNSTGEPVFDDALKQALTIQLEQPRF